MTKNIDLVSRATETLKARYKKPIHTVAACLETTTGQIYEGLNIDHFGGYVCAETSVLATAMNNGETAFKRLAAVRKEPDGSIGIANPCGKCRQILYDYCPGILVAVGSLSERREVPIEELLPFSFTRQRQKIHDARMGSTESEIVG